MGDVDKRTYGSGMPFPCDLDKVKKLYNANQHIFHPNVSTELYRAIGLLDFYNKIYDQQGGVIIPKPPTDMS